MKKINTTTLIELLIFSLLLIIPFLFFFVEPATTASLLAVNESEISLSQPDAGTSAEKAMFLTGPNEGEALDIALRYLKENQEGLELSDADLADLMVTDEYVSQHNGVTHIYLRQRFNEIEVPDGNININIAPDGSVMNVGNSFVSCPQSCVSCPQSCVASAPVLRGRSLSAIEAVHSAAAQLGLSSNYALTVQRRSRSAAQEMLLSDGGISLDSIPIKLVYQPIEEGKSLRLAWDMVIRLENGQNWWNLRVDTLTGELLTQEDWIVNENWVADEETERAIEQEQTSTSLFSPPTHTYTKRAPQAQGPPADGPQYRVFPFPYVSPEEPGASHTLVTDPSDPIASPFGWHDTDGVAGAEFNDTRGNNVFAQEDADGNNKGGFRLDGGPDLLFDYPFDPTFSPSGSLNEEASTVNLFYWSNLNHDIFYHYGFDEASGNFQHNNYGHDGIGGDALQADTLDRTSLNNANFGTPPDGQSPRMQMFVWTLTAPYRDSALENSVIVHEYAHGISNRLTGGPSNVNCLLNAEQMGEGWSDWLALAVMTTENDQATDARATGPYLLGQPPTGHGIRFYPYSTDMKINRHTYESIEKALSEHQVGEVWAQMLWEMYWVLVEEHGFNPNVYGDWQTGGNNLAIQLVMDGMKLQPCRPGFVDGRDAILAADMVLTSGANQCPIWQAFAKRGLGFSAEQGHSDSIIDGIEAFDLPPSCQFMTVTPETEHICVGETANYQIEVGSGYTPPITMSTTGLPAGSNPTFTANPVLTTSTTITLSVATSQNTITGSYPIMITGTGVNSPSPSISSSKMVGRRASGEGVERAGMPARADMIVELNVFNNAPGTVMLTNPANQSNEVNRRPTFEWTPATQAATYILEVDDHADFSSIDYTATVTDTRHTINRAFRPAQSYYWRVRAANPCDSDPSVLPDMDSTFSFTTKDSFPILLVDDDDDYPDVRDYYLDTLEALGQNVEVWDSSRRDNDPDASFLAPYEMVVWFTGDSFGDFAGPGEKGEAALAEYLDHGGCLLMSSQTYHFDKGLTPFMQDYLGVESVSEDRGHLVVSGDGAFSGLGPYTLTYPLPNYSDLVLPDETAEVAFASEMDSAGVSKDGVYRTSFWSFPFEAITTKKERQEVMQRMVDWCEVEQNITQLVGRVTDMDGSDKGQLNSGIKDATVIVRHNRIERTTTADATGHYTITLTADDDAQPIEMVVFAPNYETQTISLDRLIANNTIQQDVALRGSQLTYDRDSIEKGLQIGQIVTNTLTITNSGPLPIDYNLTIGGNYRYFIPLLLNSNANSSDDFSRSLQTRTTKAWPEQSRRVVTTDKESDKVSSDDFSRSLQTRTTEAVTTNSITDEFGYVVRDSKQANGPRYEFVNISPSGELVVLGDNNSAGPFPIDFDFDFYGTSQREFYLNSDGFISFGGGSSAPSNQCALPKARTPNHLIALMWDDFEPNDVRAQVYYQNFSACPYGGGACLIVQYDKYHYYPASNYVRASFEAILFESGDILMQYNHLGGRNGVTSTTGLENADGTMGLTYGSCDTPGHLTDKEALCFAHPNGNDCDSKMQDWASVTPRQGTIPPNSSTTLDVLFDATSYFQTDDARAHLWVHGNFVNHVEPIPLTMDVSCPTCGVLSGRLTDAENKRQLRGALEVTKQAKHQVKNQVTESDGFNVVIRGDDYHLVVAPGTYHLNSKANGYLSQSTTVTVTEGVTTTTNFDLLPDVAKLDVSLESIEKAMQIGDLITHTLTITNSGVREVTIDLNLNDVERPPAQEKGDESELIGDRSRETQGRFEYERAYSEVGPKENVKNTEPVAEVADFDLFSDVDVTANRGRYSGPIRVCPTAYHWTGSSNTLKILLYADDVIHRAPHTFPDQALRARDLTYAAYYDDWEEFEACLTNEKWDLAIFANDRGWPPSSILNALNEHLLDGGKLIYHSWTVTYSPGHPLWANMGFTWQGNNDAPDPIYWWQASHPMLTNPKSVPELTEPDELDYLIYGQHVEPLPGGLAVGGYQKTPQAEEAALILGNEGRSVFKAFLDGPNSADLDADGVLDGLELWINLVTGIQNDFANPWVRVTPDHATLAPAESATFEVLFDATSLEEVGEYEARLDVLGDFANEVDGILIRMEVGERE